MTWTDIRRHHLEKLRTALERGEVDQGIIPVLKAINRRECLVSRSSCYGRLHITLERDIIRKGYGTTLLKAHGPLEWEAVREAFNKVRKGVIWLNVEGTIIHVAAKEVTEGMKLLDIAIRSGYRESSIYSISDRGVTVEILMGEKTSIPLYIDGKPLYTDEEYRELFQEVSKIFVLIERVKHRFLENMEEMECDKS